MREVLFHVFRLFARRAVRAWWVVIASVGLALTWAPLLDAPGYELAAGLTLVLTFLGPFLTTAASRTLPSYGVAPVLASAVLLVLATMPAVVLAFLKTALGSPCDPLANAWFTPVLVFPTAMVVAALGACIGRALRRGRWVFAAWLLVIALSAVATAVPLIAGPQVFAFNHLGGYLPGPLYDEALSVPASLLWYRLATLALALGLVGIVARRRALAVLGLATFLGIELQGTRLGFRQTDQALAEALGGVIETDAFVLHHPQGLSDLELSRMLGDLRFRHHQLTEFFGAAPPGKLVVWWYRSAEDKQRLVGAAHTQFAKPWRREVHLNGLSFPNSVLKHELVHAMAAPWGSPPFGVTATLFGLSPHVGVIEGFAVAADNPVDELSLHEWTAAMKKKGLLPPVAWVMTPEGFYATPASRAYTTAGSFLRYLGEQHGKEALRTLYRDGDFQGAFGQPVEALAKTYEGWLDGVPLSDDAVNQAFSRFRQGSLFDRPCAREVDRLEQDASAALVADPDRARALIHRCRVLQPEEPTHALSEVSALRRLGFIDAAREVLDSELTRLAKEPVSWSEAALARADLAFEEGDAVKAEALWTELMARQISPASERSAQVRLASLKLPPRGLEAVRRYFQPGDEALELFLLQRALEEAPGSMPLQYLLGRRLQQLGAADLALPVLEKVLADAPPTSVAKESTRLAIEAATTLGQCDVVEGFAAQAHFGAAFQARATDWVERCHFAHP